MGNKSLPRCVMFGELEGGKGYLGGQERDWMGCLARDLSLFNFPTEAQRRETVHAGSEESGKWWSDVLRKRQNSTSSAGSSRKRII